MGQGSYDGGVFVRSWSGDPYCGDRGLRKNLPPGRRKTKSAVDIQETKKKQKFRGPVLRSKP